MVGDIAPGTVRRVELGEASQQIAQPKQCFGRGYRRLQPDLRHQQRQHAGNVAALHHDAAFGKGLAELQFRIERDRALPFCRS